MQKSFLATAIAIFGWAILTPAVHSQTTVLSANGVVDTSQPCTLRGAGFYQKTHTIAVTAGNQYTIDLRSTSASNDGSGYHADGDTYVYLLDASGTIVAENDDVIMYGGGTGIENRSLILYPATVSGTYTIIVTSWSPVPTFPYALNVTARPTVTTATGRLSGPDPTFVDPRARFFRGPNSGYVDRRTALSDRRDGRPWFRRRLQ